MFEWMWGREGGHWTDNEVTGEDKVSGENEICKSKVRAGTPVDIQLGTEIEALMDNCKI